MTQTCSSWVDGTVSTVISSVATEPKKAAVGMELSDGSNGMPPGGVNPCDGATVTDKNGPRRVMGGGGSKRSTPIGRCASGLDIAGGRRHAPRNSTPMRCISGAPKDANRSKEGGGSCRCTPPRMLVKPSTAFCSSSPAAMALMPNYRMTSVAASAAPGTNGSDKQKQSPYGRANSHTFIKRSSFHSITTADAPDEQKRQKSRCTPARTPTPTLKQQRRGEKLSFQSPAAPSSRTAAAPALFSSPLKGMSQTVRRTRKGSMVMDGNWKQFRPPPLTSRMQPLETNFTPCDTASLAQKKKCDRLGTPVHFRSSTPTHQSSETKTKQKAAIDRTKISRSATATAAAAPTLTKRTLSVSCLPGSRKDFDPAHTCNPKKRSGVSRPREESLTPTAGRKPNAGESATPASTLDRVTQQPHERASTSSLAGTSTTHAPRRFLFSGMRTHASPSVAPIVLATGRGVHASQAPMTSLVGNVKQEVRKATGEERGIAEVKYGISKRKPLLSPKPVVPRTTKSTIVRKEATRQKENRRIKREHEDLAAEVKHLPRSMWKTMRQELERLVIIREKRMGLLRAEKMATTMPLQTVDDIPDVFCDNRSATSNARSTSGRSVVLLPEGGVIQEPRRVEESLGHQVETAITASVPPRDVQQDTAGSPEDVPRTTWGEMISPRGVHCVMRERNYRRSGTSETYCGRLQVGRHSSPYRGPSHRAAEERVRKKSFFSSQRADGCRNAYQEPFFYPRLISTSLSVSPENVALMTHKTDELSNLTFSFATALSHDSEEDKENLVKEEVAKNAKTSRSPSARSPNLLSSFFIATEAAAAEPLLSPWNSISCSGKDHTEGPLVELLETVSSVSVSTLFFECTKPLLKSSTTVHRRERVKTKAPALNFCRTRVSCNLPHSGSSLMIEVQRHKSNPTSFKGLGVRRRGFPTADRGSTRNRSDSVVLSSDMLVALYATMHGTADHNLEKNITSLERMRSGKGIRGGNLTRHRAGRREMQQRPNTVRSLSFSKVLVSHGNTPAPTSVSKTRASSNGSVFGPRRGMVCSTTVGSREKTTSLSA